MSTFEMKSISCDHRLLSNTKIDQRFEKKQSVCTVTLFLSFAIVEPFPSWNLRCEPFRRCLSISIFCRCQVRANPISFLSRQNDQSEMVLFGSRRLWLEPLAYRRSWCLQRIHSTLHRRLQNEFSKCSLIHFLSMLNSIHHEILSFWSKSVGINWETGAMRPSA